jgi:hypothetical protein
MVSELTLCSDYDKKDVNIIDIRGPIFLTKTDGGVGWQ